MTGSFVEWVASFGERPHSFADRRPPYVEGPGALDEGAGAVEGLLAQVEAPARAWIEGFARYRSASRSQAAPHRPHPGKAVGGAAAVG